MRTANRATAGNHVSLLRRIRWLGRNRRIVLVFLLLGSALTVRPSPAAEPNEGHRISIELNKTEPAGDTCRAYILLKNPGQTEFRSLKLDLVMFDADGVVAKRLAVETAPLAAGKTSLKVFDIDGLSCEAISRMLLNDVTACADASGKRDDCLALISTSARGRVDLIK